MREAEVPAEVPQEAVPLTVEVEKEVVVEAELEAEVVEKAVEEVAEVEEAASALTPLPAATQVPLAAMPAPVTEAEGFAAGTPEVVETTVAANGDGGPTAEPAVLSPTPIPSPAMQKVAEDTSTAPVTAAAEPGEDVGIAEPPPSPGEVGETGPRAAEETVAEAEEAAHEWEAPGSARAELTRTSLWRVLEISLGLTALGLTLATIWAWRIRRR